MHDAMAHAASWKFVVLLAMWVLVAASLNGCGQSDLRKPGGSIVQVPREGASRESGAALRIAESLERGRSAPASSPAPVRMPAIDRDLLAQEALGVGVDRDPDVAQEIENARREILAQAYIDRAVTFVPPASPREIRDFYERNPALFAQRRVYRVLELEVTMGPEQFGELQDAVVRAKDLAAVMRWLDARQLPFETVMFSRTAEQIPMDVLHRASGMRDGEIAVFPVPGGASVAWLVQSVQTPLTEKQARASIARYLLNRRRIDLALTEVTKLRERVRIGRDEAMAAVSPPFSPRVAVQDPAMTGQQHGAIDQAKTR